MKKMMIVILALLAAGGFAEMTKEQFKNQLFEDAQKKRTELLTPPEEVSAILKERSLVRGFSVQEMISLAQEYSVKYPLNSENLLDRDLREIARIKDIYFTGLPKIDHSKAEETAQGGLPWWAWALIGAGAVSLIGGGIFGRGRG